MGDRANVIIKSGSEAVCLYTHWYGTKLPQILRAAMNRGRDRWDHGAYLARIIFCEMTRGDEEGLTGYGISVEPPAGRDRIITLDTDNQTVQIQDAEPMSFSAFTDGDSKWRA